MKIGLSGRWLVGSVASLASLALAGCGDTTSSDLTFDLSFAGQTCSAAKVDTIDMTAQSPSGIYSSQVSCGAAAKLLGVPPGNYTVTVQGLSQGQATFQGSNTIQVWNWGTSSYPITLTASE